MSSAAVYWMLHLLVDPAGTGAEGVMIAVPLPALAMADTHAATESTVNAPKKRSHRGVKRRGRITALSNNRELLSLIERCVRRHPLTHRASTCEGKVGAKWGREMSLAVEPVKECPAQPAWYQPDRR